MARLKQAPARLGTVPPRLARPDGAPVRPLLNPLKNLYSTARWRRLRWETLKRDLFTCRWPGCGRLHHDTRLLVADHVEPHRGSLALFWDPDNLQTLCKSPCHDKHKQALEALAAGR